MSDPNPSTRLLPNERRVLIILAVINFTHILDFMVMMPLGPQLKRVFDVDPQQWSIIVSSYTTAAFFSALLSVFFLDYFDRKKALVFLYGGFLIATFLVGLSSSYEMLVGTRALAGLFGGVINAVILSIVGDMIPFERRGTAMGIVSAGFSAAASVGVPIGMYFGTAYSWKFPFFAIAIAGVAVWFFAGKMIPPLREHLKAENQHKPREGLMAMLKDRNQIYAMVFLVLLLFGQFSIIPFISPFMVSNVGFTEMEVTYIYAVGGTLSIFAFPFIGRLADRYGKVKVFTILAYLSLFPIFIITNLSETPIWIVLIISASFFAFAGGRFIPANAMIISTAIPKYRGSFMSIRSSVQSGAQSLSALIAGYLVVENEGGFYEYYWQVGLVAIVCSLLSIAVIRKIKATY